MLVFLLSKCIKLSVRRNSKEVVGILFFSECMNIILHRLKNNAYSDDIQHTKKNTEFTTEKILD